MIFWESCEADALIFDNLVIVARMSDVYLNSAFASSILKNFNITLRYIPIVMTEENRDYYPERSKARIKQHIYVCAPQLDYRVFAKNDLKAHLDEYLRGIAQSSPHLKKFGATPDQIEVFDKIIATARDGILSMTD
jgi:hypothetical protein